MKVFNHNCEGLLCAAPVSPTKDLSGLCSGANIVQGFTRRLLIAPGSMTSLLKLAWKSKGGEKLQQIQTVQREEKRLPVYL